jgi:3-hydroxyacyl-CoA dehydrogenase/enoyl-CoA hydratase/3-hydroxybutyryl-CoA epimerase/3-hydroxyacyl-CoA dehydrogenase/enoyl-CoA hydratase/3-hydroxybutyryl-CoA epimerase/enoyl-CoA isomerase
MASALRLSFPEPDIALLEFDLPGKSVNVLSRAVVEELAAHLDTLERRSDLAGLILISAKPSGFIAGADIREFLAALQSGAGDVAAMSRQGHNLFRRLSSASFVSVAAIHGVCLGGGAELSAWCDLCVMTTDERTEYGCPEVKLGLIPGWGGTARLPRLVGLANAVELITGGESIDARKAFALGLAWDVVAPDQLLPAAIRAVRAARQEDRFRLNRKRANDPIKMSETELAFLGATANAMIQQETHGNYPAPLVALELLLEASSLLLDEALEREAVAFQQVFGTPVNQALINVFFLTDRAKKPPAGISETATPRQASQVRQVGQVGVVGAGIMGAGIAAATVKRELATTLVDTQPAALEKGTREVLQEVAFDKRTRKPDPQRALKLGAKLHGADALASLAHCDLVVEAIVENIEAKQKLYRELEPLISPDAVLATNTSTIPNTKLADGLAHPERFCGIHFFNPVRRMKLVEIIRGAKSSDDTLASAAAYARQIGKFAIVVKDGPGFLVNRLLSPYLSAALELINDGVSIKEIDKASLKFGMPIGPIALYDLVGLDTAFYAGKTMYEAYPDRFIASPIIPSLMKAGRLGRKNGLGFYSYQNKKQKAETDPAAEAILAQYVKTKRNLSLDEITLRLFLPMLLEATRALEEQVVADPRDVDAGLIYGLGFPPFKGGLLFWADTIGSAKLLEMVQSLQGTSKSLAPTKLLQEMAAANKRFYK